ncbi:hypothetical protein HYZ97_03880 [Candidatus Pacearchaeota archaeon]|nr:hypothetical protein [Candidatus Pacearchaeota archaeon]
MNRRGRWMIWASLIGVIILVVALFLYYSLVSPDYSAQYQGTRVLVNPAANLSLEEVEQQFDETFVYYLLAASKAYNLHNPPLSSDTPKIEIVVGDDTYSAVIEDGEILVAQSALENEDIRLITSTNEAAKMVKYPSSIKESFGSGSSQVELLASKTILFSKGYLNLYTELTGKSIAGNVVRIYAG